MILMSLDMWELKLLWFSQTSMKIDICKIFLIFKQKLRFKYQKKAPTFLITCENFYSWYMFRFEDISESVTNYG